MWNNGNYSTTYLTPEQRKKAKQANKHKETCLKNRKKRKKRKSVDINTQSKKTTTRVGNTVFATTNIL